MLPVNSSGHVNVISLSLRFIDPIPVFFYCCAKSKSPYLKGIARYCNGDEGDLERVQNLTNLELFFDIIGKYKYINTS